MLSLIYIFSALSLLCAFLFLPKSSNRQEIVIWIPICYIAYECFITLIASVFSIIHIPVNLASIGIVNIIVSVFCAVRVKKAGKMQQYEFKIENMFFFILLLIIIVLTGYERYGSNYQICFETSDPATHLKMAMDTVNKQSVITSTTTMFLTPFTNGIFIRILQPFFNDVNIYKSFIIKELINFGLSGAVFYSSIYRYLKTFAMRLFGMGITIFYLFGYPYNNLLFGFSYLGFAVSITAFLLFVTNMYINTKEYNKVIISFISLGCFGVAQCYTLFAPFVFISVFICIAYKVKQDYGHVVVSRQFYTDELRVFLLPTILTVWFVILYPRIGNAMAGSDYGSVLTWEGYTYRNLYADFLIVFPVAFYAVSRQIKAKKCSANACMFWTVLLYTVIFFFEMYRGEISTYYYYKLNFMSWMVLFLLFVEGICEIYSTMREFAVCYCGCWGIIFLLWFTRCDARLNEKNVLFNPFPNAKSCYEIYDFNRIIRERKSTVSSGLVQLCHEVNRYDREDGQFVLYLGNWLDNYWYEALTNQRQPVYCTSDPPGFIQSFMNGEYGNYLAVAKNDEDLEEYYGWIQYYEVVFENNYGMIIKRE